MLGLMNRYSYELVGPVMYEYTSWIIEQAKSRGIKRIYFLARDGYLLYRLACEICRKRSIDIECRYLYCSRRSLRLPSFHIIGDEMYDMLFMKSQHMTPKTILLRGGSDEEECTAFLRGTPFSDPDRSLSDSEFEALADHLRNNSAFREAVYARSAAEYHEAVSYFRQEGLFDSDHVAIADSGWTGSMQRSLRQILEAAGYTGRITGFYFGMFESPREEKDGEYLTFYFNSKSSIKRKVLFNNNLFECMLSADHGMTLKYQTIDGKTSPVLGEEHSEPVSRLIQAQIAGALRYTDTILDSSTGAQYDVKKSVARCYKLLKKGMVFPDTDEVELYSNFMFCDDTTEDYHFSLADQTSRKKLSYYLFIPRLIKKLLRLNKRNTTDLFWPCGVAAYCPAFVRNWYCINIILWDWLRFGLK